MGRSRPDRGRRPSTQVAFTLGRMVRSNRSDARKRRHRVNAGTPTARPFTATRPAVDGLGIVLRAGYPCIQKCFFGVKRARRFWRRTCKLRRIAGVSEACLMGDLFMG